MERRKVKVKNVYGLIGRDEYREPLSALGSYRRQLGTLLQVPVNVALAVVVFFI
jgi:hypothetical protein